MTIADFTRTALEQHLGAGGRRQLSAAAAGRSGHSDVRIAELVAEYRDPPLRTVDASEIASAERLDATEVAPWNACAGCRYQLGLHLGTSSWSRMPMTHSQASGT